MSTPLLTTLTSKFWSDAPIKGRASLLCFFILFIYFTAFVLMKIIGYYSVSSSSSLSDQQKSVSGRRIAGILPSDGASLISLSGRIWNLHSCLVRHTLTNAHTSVLSFNLWGILQCVTRWLRPSSSVVVKWLHTHTHILTCTHKYAHTHISWSTAIHEAQLQAEK